jgi:RDD family
MRLAVPRDAAAASWPRRAAAGTIDTAVIATVAGALFGPLGIAAADDKLPRWIKGPMEGNVWSHPAFLGALESLQLTGRNWRSPGMRALGIRRVDARTGGAVSVRSAFIGLLLQTSSQGIGRAFGQPALKRAEARQRAANDEIERMRASRPDEDPQQLMIDAAEIRRRHGASTCIWMLPRMLVRVAIEQLPVPWTGVRQTLTERLAGTVVISER